MRRGIAMALIGLPVALLAVIGIEVALLSRREYLPTDPGYRVDALVTPASGGSGMAVEVAVLGDSTVAGVGSPTEAGTLAVLVAQRVADAIGRPVHVVGHGISGARTGTVAATQLPLVAAGTDAILIVVGSNDATHATPWRAFGRQARDLLAAASTTGAAVVLGSTPRFHGTEIIPQPLRLMVDTYAGILRGVQRSAVAATPGARLVDLSLVAPRFEGVPEATSRDGFHPSPIGYGFWADALAEGVVAAVDERS
jgi:lysophospholipase L1-like esterase